MTVDAIAVKTTVEIDWTALGQEFAHLSSVDQAAFIDGFTGSIESMGHDGQMQLAYLASDLNKSSSTVAVKHLTDLLSFLTSATHHKETVLDPRPWTCRLHGQRTATRQEIEEDGEEAVFSPRDWASQNRQDYDQ